MNQYYFRKVTKNDIARIVEVYNSNKKFLVNHLGDESIDASFINNELAEMERINFLSYVIIDAQKEIIVGVIDYKPKTTVYLSLIIIDSQYQGLGIGALAYSAFEKEMLQLGKQAIRIDVVNDYNDNVVGFWEKQGFISRKQIKLSWGKKQSKALVMEKALT